MPKLILKANIDQLQETIASEKDSDRLESLKKLLAKEETKLAETSHSTLIRPGNIRCPDALVGQRSKPCAGTPPVTRCP